MTTKKMEETVSTRRYAGILVDEDANPYIESIDPIFHVPLIELVLKAESESWKGKAFVANLTDEDHDTILKLMADLKSKEAHDYLLAHAQKLHILTKRNLSKFDYFMFMIRGDVNGNRNTDF